MNRVLSIVFLFMIVIGTAWTQEETTSQPAGETIVDATPYEWKKILPPMEFEFPRDHGAHMDTKVEWWYLTGNLKSDNGREFGIQVTFFRHGLSEKQDEAELEPNQLIIGHLGIADVKNEKFFHTQEMKRIGGGFAGASEDKMLVWLGDWELESHFESIHFLGSYPEKNIDLKIKWTPVKPLVKHGEEGYSQKGEDPGNSSAYISYTRLDTEATLTLDGETYELTGLSWFDHEWGSSQLGKGIVGWDWWGLHLDDGRDLMLYQLRYASGLPSPFSSGTLIDKNGNTTHIKHDDFTARPKKSWTSTASGAKYPIQWDIEVEKHDIAFTVVPKLESTEMVTEETSGVSYWEGPVILKGDTTGSGYMELTGYAQYLQDKF